MAYWRAAAGDVGEDLLDDGVVGVLALGRMSPKQQSHLQGVLSNRELEA